MGIRPESSVSMCAHQGCFLQRKLFQPQLFQQLFTLSIDTSSWEEMSLPIRLWVGSTSPTKKEVTLWRDYWAGTKRLWGQAETLKYPVGNAHVRAFRICERELFQVSPSTCPSSQRTLMSVVVFHVATSFSQVHLIFCFISNMDSHRKGKTF